MSDPYIGEIRMIAANFPPKGWLFCDGQVLQINQYNALYTLIGTTYGGDGQSTFNLPAMNGRIPIHAGTGPGLSSHALGSMGGHEKVKLTVDEIPQHSHQQNGTTEAGDTINPGQALYATLPAKDFLYLADGAVAPMADGTAENTGGGQSHSNLMPTQGINFIIAVSTGIPPTP